MHIREIAFDGFDGPEPEGMKPGTVSLISANGRIEIALLAPPRISPWKVALRRRILAQAIEKVMRMPEYRAGDEELSFDDGLLSTIRSEP
ncbi:hypothetical protein KO516_02095 [Citreicella sp. C3M06]|uniref:hypothetical protein n=1 Tax=Roseobacteraceae TaxID=2854170 RepID=UPI001C09C3D9|nr:MULTISPECIES: hypothetical protein [Roseobacteraceae]MBU2959632.1 hypothetical protein [Citreicella sp. C3M06]MDO6586203.1 hypothetical protein [Salipiger sp. 1_MG-2023]